MWHSIIGIGGSCFATCTDNKTVLKSYEVWEDGKIRASSEVTCEPRLAHEADVYQAIGTHPQILQFLGMEEIHEGVHALRLELAPFGSVRDYIKKHEETPPIETRLQMALDVAVGLAHIHSRQIWHSDLSCRNIFLFKGEPGRPGEPASDLRAKIGDFGGSVLPGCEYQSTTFEEAEYDLPNRGREYQARPRVKRELFALGSAFYEIVAWRRMFPGVGQVEVDEILAREEFPAVDSGDVAILGPIIDQCWHEGYDNACDVLRDLQAVVLKE